MQQRKEITFDRFIRIGLSICGVILALMLINRLSGVLLPFFIAWIIAYMLYPLVKFFQYRLKFNSRVLSIFASLLTISCIGGLLTYFVIPPMVVEVGRVKDLIFDYINSGGQAEGYIPATLKSLIKEYIDLNVLSNLLDQRTFVEAFQKALPQLWSLITGSVSFIINLFTVFLIMLCDFYPC